MLWEYFTINKINIKLIDINYKLILSNCNIIAIAGDSGSGKTTLTNYLLNIFEKHNYCKIETDRYHKWERGDSKYLEFSHLNPMTNHLEKMNEDIYKLKIGHEIYSVDYNHTTGKFTQEEKIESKNNIILCGLHTLYNDITNNIIDLKIFLDTDRELIKKWKIKRDVEERGYSIEKVIKQIENREKDYFEYISNQKKNADIIIKFYELYNDLNCEIKLNKKLSTYKNYLKLSNYNFDFENKNNLIKIKLKNEIEYIKYKNIIFPNNFYGEICLLLKIILLD
jgi:uridine kinase